MRLRLSAGLLGLAAVGAFFNGCDSHESPTTLSSASSHSLSASIVTDSTKSRLESDPAGAMARRRNFLVDGARFVDTLGHEWRVRHLTDGMQLPPPDADEPTISTKPLEQMSDEEFAEANKPVRFEFDGSDIWQFRMVRVVAADVERARVARAKTRAGYRLRTSTSSPTDATEIAPDGTKTAIGGPTTLSQVDAGTAASNLALPVNGLTNRASAPNADAFIDGVRSGGPNEERWKPQVLPFKELETLSNNLAQHTLGGAKTEVLASPDGGVLPPYGDQRFYVPPSLLTTAPQSTALLTSRAPFGDNFNCTLTSVGHWTAIGAGHCIVEKGVVHYPYWTGPYSSYYYYQSYSTGYTGPYSTTTYHPPTQALFATITMSQAWANFGGYATDVDQIDSFIWSDYAIWDFNGWWGGDAFTPAGGAPGSALGWMPIAIASDNDHLTTPGQMFGYDGNGNIPFCNPAVPNNGCCDIYTQNCDYAPQQPQQPGSYLYADPSLVGRFFVAGSVWPTSTTADYFVHGNELQLNFSGIPGDSGAGVLQNVFDNAANGFDPTLYWVGVFSTSTGDSGSQLTNRGPRSHLNMYYNITGCSTEWSRARTVPAGSCVLWE